MFSVKAYFERLRCLGPLVKLSTGKALIKTFLKRLAPFSVFGQIF